MLKYCGLLTFALLVGCGETDSGPKTVEASGAVTIDGSPATMAQVIFIDDAGQYPASGMTDEQGKFSLSLNGVKKGAVPGSYKVQISKTRLGSTTEGGADVSISYGLPKKYATYLTSGLTFTIPDSGASDIKFELTSK